MLTNINSTQPDMLSHQLDTYTLPKPIQTPTTHSNNNLDTEYILAQLAQSKKPAISVSILCNSTEDTLTLTVNSFPYEEAKQNEA